MIVQTPASRATDPESSFLAEAHINETGKRAYQQQQAIAAVRAYPGMTSFELSVSTRLDRYMLARRLPECITAGQVERGILRTCKITGRTALTWWPTNYPMELAP